MARHINYPYPPKFSLHHQITKIREAKKEEEIYVCTVDDVHWALEMGRLGLVRGPTREIYLTCGWGLWGGQSQHSWGPHVLMSTAADTCEVTRNPTSSLCDNFTWFFFFCFFANIPGNLVDVFPVYLYLSLILYPHLTIYIYLFNYCYFVI